MFCSAALQTKARTNKDMRKVYSRGYTNPAPTREPGAVSVPIKDLALQAGNYRVDLQYDPLMPRDIDPSAILRKSEGQLMETFQAESLLSAALDQLAIDQMRQAQSNENAARIEAIARDTHVPTTLVEAHVRGHAAAQPVAQLVQGLGAHTAAHAAREREAAHTAS